MQTPYQSDLSEQISKEDASDMDLNEINQPSTFHMSKDKAKEMCASIIVLLYYLLLNAWKSMSMKFMKILKNKC